MLMKIRVGVGLGVVESLLNLRVGPTFNRARIGNGVVLWNMMV